MNRSKFYTTAFAVLCLAIAYPTYTQAGGTKVTVRATGKGATGYNRVVEKHRGSRHILELSGSGHEDGTWMHPPQIDGGATSMDVLDKEVQAAMQSSAQTGSFSRNGNITVMWKRLRDGYKYTVVDR